MTACAERGKTDMIQRACSFHCLVSVSELCRTQNVDPSTEEEQLTWPRCGRDRRRRGRSTGRTGSPSSPAGRCRGSLHQAAPGRWPPEGKYRPRSFSWAHRKGTFLQKRAFSSGQPPSSDTLQLGWPKPRILHRAKGIFGNDSKITRP